MPGLIVHTGYMSCHIAVAREVTVQTPLQSRAAQWFASDVDMKQAVTLCLKTHDKHSMLGYKL